MDVTQTNTNDQLITLTAEIVAAHASNNSVSLEELPTLIRKVYDAMAGLGAAEPPPEPPAEPKVPVRSSVKKDHLVCLSCGRKMKVLKRHLKADHDLTPAEYRSHWGLPDSYPMAAPDYAEARSNLAKSLGLGRKPGQKRGRRKAAA